MVAWLLPQVSVTEGSEDQGEGYAAKNPPMELVDEDVGKIGEPLGSDPFPGHGGAGFGGAGGDADGVVAGDGGDPHRAFYPDRGEA